MFEIKNNKIKTIQGDTGAIRLTLDNYSLKPGDTITFTLKKTYGETPIIKKEVTEFDSGTALVYLSAYETNIEAGDYLYDIQANLSDGRVDTVVVPSKFTVLGGITDAE